MFQRILIANRGEIALRVLRACREMDIEAVCIFSEADRGAPYLDLADRAVCIGPAAAAKSYLDVSRIMSAAAVTDCDAVHPGYGFLAENAHFAEVVNASGMTFIGPSPHAIRTLGNKTAARKLATESGVPLLPGTTENVETEEEAREIARDIGYPVIIKAASGGGGRGMRVAHNEAALVSGYTQAKTEAGAAFKDDSVYIEKFLENPRHVEVQLIADSHGNVVYCGERDCSMQRRNQKLVEEAPCPVLDAEQRKAIGECAVRLARAAGYVTAGTAEFLMDSTTGQFYFMEVNTRIQVEHPVSELVTGIDLIRAQIMAAAGQRLPFTQDDIVLRGHAIECRINAEDVDANFRPSPGKIQGIFIPGGRGVRWDSHVTAGYVVPPNYDSMVGKLIVHGDTREEAITIMRRALKELRVEGIPTTVPLHLRIMNDGNFQSGAVHIHYLERTLLKS
jgi:acetyl-CoA carboxylase biotin carboxylase subunit